MNLIIHIGYHKTGTTAIQNLLTTNRDLLLEHGIVYPASLGSWPGHPELAWIFEREPWPWQNQIYDEQVVKEYYQSIFDTHKDTNATVVISSEEFCRLEYNFDGFLGLRSFLLPYNPIILGYVRTPVSFLTSRYCHEVQNGQEKRSLRDFLCSYDNLQSADFRSRTMKWNQHFHGRCIFRNYESVRDQSNSILPNFLELIGYSDNNNLLKDTYTERKLHPALLDIRRVINSLPLSKLEHGRYADAILQLGDSLPSDLVKLTSLQGVSQDVVSILSSINQNNQNINTTCTIETIYAQAKMIDERIEGRGGMEEVIQERDATISAQVKLIDERVVGMGIMEGMIQERDATILAQAKLIDERVEGMGIMEGMIQERDVTILAQAKLIDERSKRIRDLESNLMVKAMISLNLISAGSIPRPAGRKQVENQQIEERS